MKLQDFCLHCGELLLAKWYSVRTDFSDRYRIIQAIRAGGFGRTFEDINHFREYCVLKEFAPQVQSTSLPKGGRTV